MSIDSWKVCVIIPIYKSELNANELISLTQGLKMFKRYSISLIAPESLDITIYKSFTQDCSNLSFMKFDDKFFKGIKGYNSLLLSLHFIKKFIQYEFILIYQLDAFVFKDELEYWCNLEYDYIGAPWFEGMGAQIVIVHFYHIVVTEVFH
jgi:hypothetical protein